LAAAAFATVPMAEVMAKATAAKKKVAIVETGHRGIGMWGNTVMREFSDM